MDHKKIKTLQGLANYLRCEKKFLESYLGGNVFIYDYRTKGQPNFSDPYLTIIHLFFIQKKRNGNRKIYSIESESFKNALKIFNTSLNGIYFPNALVHGFVSGRSIKTNAECHLSKKSVLSIDIQDFYESITSEMIETSLRNLGFESKIAKILSLLLTIKGKLPQGYPTSPTIANLVVNQMDTDIENSIEAGITYTRYADDLYFSSNQNLPTVQALEKIINVHDFKLNYSKTKLMKGGGIQYVTGLTVFDSAAPRIAKKIKKNMRLEVYFINKFGFRGHVIRQLGYSYKDYNNNSNVYAKVETEILRYRKKTLGWINFINSVEKEAAKKLFDKLTS